MNDVKKRSIVEKYDSYEDVPAADKAWITMRAERAGKSVKMSHAGYKAAFTRIQNNIYITILFEDVGYLGGGTFAEPIYHIIYTRNEKMLFSKIENIVDTILATADTELNEENKKFLENKNDNIHSLIIDREEIEIDGTKLKIISEPDWVFVC